MEEHHHSEDCFRQQEAVLAGQGMVVARHCEMVQLEGREAVEVVAMATVKTGQEGLRLAKTVAG